MKTVKMHGPGISDPSKIVERDVPENDVVAYQQAGYTKGPIPSKSDAQAIADNDGEDVTKAEPAAKPTKAKPRSKAKK